jgi:DUF438 domain-containing protein
MALVIRTIEHLDDQAAKLVVDGDLVSGSGRLSIEEVRAIYQQLARQRDASRATSS